MAFTILVNSHYSFTRLWLVEGYSFEHDSLVQEGYNQIKPSGFSMVEDPSFSYYIYQYFFPFRKKILQINGYSFYHHYYYSYQHSIVIIAMTAAQAAVNLMSERLVILQHFWVYQPNQKFWFAALAILIPIAITV